MGGRGSVGGKSTFDKESVVQGINSMEDYWGDLKNLVPLYTEDEALLEKLNSDWKNSWIEKTRKLKGEVELPISSLYTIQPDVEEENLKNIALVNKGEIKGIAVVKYKGKYVLMDGNHRVNAAILRGYKKIKVNLYTM